MKFGSLFAGFGGLDLGFERAGFECRWQVEIDDYATAVLTKHWPDVPKWRDVRTWPQPDAERVDVICGGFPCQDISVAGRGEGLSGKRSGLWFEFYRIVREMGPRYVVIENVPALLGRGLSTVLGCLTEIGFDAEWSTISTCSMGAPHTRERLFVVAYRNEVRRRCVGHDSKRRHGVDPRLNAWETAPRGKWGDVVCWVKSLMETGGGVVPATERGGMADRVPNRLERIGGCGNAVSPQVAEIVARKVLEIENESTLRALPKTSRR